MKKNLTINLKDFNVEQRETITTLIAENVHLNNVRNISLATFKDIDILIYKWDMCKKDSIFHEDFYKRFKAIFPVEYKESQKMKFENKNGL